MLLSLSRPPPHGSDTHGRRRSGRVYSSCDLRLVRHRMAMRYTHAMEDAKRRAVEAIAVGAKRNAGDTPALPVSRYHSVTNEKRAASQIAVRG